MIIKILFIVCAAAGMLAAETTLALSVNGATDTAVERGEPLLIAVCTVAADEATNLAKAVQLKLTRSDGSEVEITPLEGRSSAGNVLDQQFANRTWMISPDDAARLNVGDYFITAASGDVSATAAFRLHETIPDEDAQHTARKRLALSQWHESQGNTLEALAQAEALVEAQPENLAARLRKVDSLISLGRNQEALEVADLAEVLYRKLNPHRPGTPRAITDRQDKLLGR